MEAKRNIPQNLEELEVYLLLQKAKLLQYYDAFINHGGDDVQQLTELLKDPKEFNQLIKLVGMDKKPLHIQRLKKALLQYSPQNITTSTSQQQKYTNNKEPFSVTSHYSQDERILNHDSVTNTLTSSNWCPFLPPTVYSGLNMFPTPSIINSLPTTQCILPTNLQNINPILNQWALLNNPQNYSMFQALAMGIINQQQLITPMKTEIDENDNKFVTFENLVTASFNSPISRLSGYNDSVEQLVHESNQHHHYLNNNNSNPHNQVTNHDLTETSQSPTQSTIDSPNSENIISRNNSPLPQLSLPSNLQPSTLISYIPSSSNSEIDLTTCTQINIPQLLMTTNYSEDLLKVRPSATLMKSDYIKLEFAINALIPYLPKFYIRKPNPRNSNEQEIQEILKLPENDSNRINGLKKHSMIFGRMDTAKRLTRPLRHFEITINEITNRLVQQIPELVTQREHLFHIARQIVNIMNYGLSVDQIGQILLQLKLEMQDIVNKEVSLRIKIRFPDKDSASNGNTNSLRRDLEKLVSQLHKCISKTAKYTVLLKSAPNNPAETVE
ncbi:unnamed protein product [Heterobilharzia americana]|nr:unnamed protein product [Heterobilharzia americana]